MFCSNCGNQLKEGENFCPKCGRCASPEASSSEQASSSDNSTVTEVYNNAEDNNEVGILTPFKKISSFLSEKTSLLGGEMEDLNAASLGWKHLLAAAILGLIIISWFIPVFLIECPLANEYIEGFDRISVSIAAPFSDDEVEFLFEQADTEVETLALADLAVVILFDFLPMGLALLSCIKPIFKGTLTKKRRMGFCRFVAGWTIIKVIFFDLVIFSILEEALNEVDMFDKFDFKVGAGSWMIVIFSIILLIVCRAIKKENEKLHEKEYVVRR